MADVMLIVTPSSLVIPNPLRVAVDALGVMAACGILLATLRTVPMHEPLRGGLTVFGACYLIMFALSGAYHALP